MFENLDLKPTYNSYTDDIAEEFYSPVLSHAVSFDRVTAYFSAAALAHYAKGLESFARRGNQYRLIISSQISEEDYEEIKVGYKIKETVLNSLLRSLQEGIDLSVEMGISNLAYLISLDIVHIKFAFTKRGIFHDKFGIIRDADGRTIDFRGSNNETEAAISANYESFQLTCDWLSSAFDRKKIKCDADTFETLWENRFDNVIVIDAPQVILDEILSFNKGTPVTDPVLLMENCVILDLTNTITLSMRLSNPEIITSGAFYKLKLRQYVESNDDDGLIFRENLSYIDYKKIIQHFEKHAERYGYSVGVSRRLQNYINSKEMYIELRAQTGLNIKRQSPEFLPHFMSYKAIVDREMARPLRDRQMWDSFFMYYMKKSGNFSVPGSGKTASVLGVYAYLHAIGKVKRILVISPLNAFDSWKTEFEVCFQGKQALRAFDSHSPEFTTTAKTKRAIKLDSGNKNLLLFNYESLPTFEQELKGIVDENTLVVLDEVHKVKAPNGKRAEKALAITRDAFYTIALTGTPIPNTYMDIYNLLHILYPDEYDDYFAFTPNILRDPTFADIEYINERIQPFFCRTSKDQLMVPPASPDRVLPIPTTPDEEHLFRIVKSAYRNNPLAQIIRILQMTSNPKMLQYKIDPSIFRDVLEVGVEDDDISFVDESEVVQELIDRIDVSSKRKACVELVNDLVNEGKSVIVWCVFVDSITGIAELLRERGVTVETISGSTLVENRAETLDRFRAKEFDVLITNPHTLAESVSLHSVCHDAVYFEYSFNLVHLLQSKDRIHRLGLPDGQYTQYHFLQSTFETPQGGVCSLDAAIYHRLLEKEQTMLEAIDREILEQLPSTDEDIRLILGELL